MDDKFLQAKIAKIADSDQSNAIIFEHLKRYFLDNPSTTIDQWQDCRNIKDPTEFKNTVEAAIYWYGVVKVREKIFELIEKHCYLNDDGDMQLKKGDMDGYL